MYSIKATNVNEAFPLGIQLLNDRGVPQSSQHGDTLEMPEPVSVCYLNPRERILFDKDRASNPFLNLFEALWIIAGRNDAEFLQHLVPRMKNYSDDGVTYYGAYGYRMQEYGQMEAAIDRLRNNPDDRQVVLTIRQPWDMTYTGKDQPCNLLVSCKIRNGKLNIHVFNRSNDFIWGMTGTNVVQFSMLQEYLAGRIGVPVGTYHQTTDSMHVYVNDQWEALKHKRPGGQLCLYQLGQVKPYDMMEGCENGSWDGDLAAFFHHIDKNVKIITGNFSTPFFKDVVVPLWNAFEHYELYRNIKFKECLDDAIGWAHTSAPCDWHTATIQWLKNIQEKQNA